MKNWAGNVVFNPIEVAEPTSEEAIQQVVLKAANERKKVRMIGSGHSFTSLFATNDILVSLDKYQGLISVNKEKQQATVKAGTKLKYLGELLFEQGLAMENLGDIDVQSIAGAFSSGTHGTGKAFGIIATQLVNIKFINGKGEIVECSPNHQPDLFKAAQVSLGTLGIITEVTVQCVPSYKLALQSKSELLEEVLANINQRNDDNRNFEFYWFPHTDKAWTKTSNIATEGEPKKVNFWNYLSEYVLENHLFKVLCDYAHWFPSQNKTIAKISASSLPNVKKLYYSHKVYATVRLVRFKEMEYNIPAEAHEDVLKEVIKAFQSQNFPVHFPIENRWVKADDIFMSPANGRDSAYLAFHVYHKKDHTAYFKCIEEICRAHGGRPHWGKMNTLTAQDVLDLYPEFPKFNAIRAAQDPDNLFITPYLEKLLDIEPSLEKANA